jgi:acyl-CoA synthetase (NDP forming)
MECKNKDMKTIALSEYRSKELLKGLGIEIPEEYFVKTEEECLKAAKEIGYPVVLKGTGEGIAHKTEKGLVKVKIMDEEGLKRAYREILSTGEKIEGMLLQKFIPGKREFIAGIVRDPQFGPVIMFGLGGIFTEVLKDVTFRIAPIEKVDAEEMISELKSAKLLDAFRGEKPVNKEKLISLLVKLSEVPFKDERIAEIDLNPIIPWEDEIYIVDALVVLKDEGKN